MNISGNNCNIYDKDGNFLGKVESFEIETNTIIENENGSIKLIEYDTDKWCLEGIIYTKRFLHLNVRYNIARYFPSIVGKFFVTERGLESMSDRVVGGIAHLQYLTGRKFNLIHSIGNFKIIRADV